MRPPPPFRHSVTDEPQHLLHGAEVPHEQFLLRVNMAGQRIEQVDTGALHEGVLGRRVLRHDEQQDSHEALVVEDLQYVNCANAQITVKKVE